MNTNKDLVNITQLTSQDRLEELLRKKPQVEKPSTKIPLKNPENYPQLHFDNQDDLDAFDSLMRKKVFFQNFVDGTKDFVSNGTKTTFGIFTKETRERKLETSNLVKKQNDYVRITY